MTLYLCTPGGSVRPLLLPLTLRNGDVLAAHPLLFAPCCECAADVAIDPPVRGHGPGKVYCDNCWAALLRRLEEFAATLPSATGR